MWTTLLGPDYRPLAPQSGDVPPFTAIISITSQGVKTRYTATAMHAGPSGHDRPEARGPHHGWAMATEQLVETCHGLRD